jgi:hypothetical protein
MPGLFVKRTLMGSLALLGAVLVAHASAPASSDFSWMERRIEALADPARARVRPHFSHDVINPHPLAPQGEVEHAFFPDPTDVSPLGERIPLILVHGFDTDQSHLPFDPALNNHWDSFRFSDDYTRLRSSMKPYIFTYRPFADMRETGSWLAAEVRDQVLPDLPAGRRIVVMSISGGALVSRYAFAEEDLIPKVAYILTLNGANRGSVLASMIRVKRSIRKRIGWGYAALLRWSRRGKEPTPGLLSLTYDNFDGTIRKEDEERHGVVVNHALREFNRTDPNRHKLITYQNKPNWLIGRGAYGVDYSLRRHILSNMHSTWATADPVIHKRSGLLAGVGLIRRRFFTGLDHYSLNDDQVMSRLVEDLGEIIRVLRMQRRVDGEGDPPSPPAPPPPAPPQPPQPPAPPQPPQPPQPEDRAAVAPIPVPVPVFPDVDGPVPPPATGE